MVDKTYVTCGTCHAKFSKHEYNQIAGYFCPKCNHGLLEDYGENEEENLSPTMQCPSCDEVNFSWKSRCVKCGKSLVNEGSSQKTKKAKSKAADENQKESEDSRQEQECFIFSCLSCDKSLRIAFPFKSLRFRCASCNGMYDIHSVNSGRPIYLVVPVLNKKTTSNPPPRQPPMPEAVRRALLFFDLSEDVSWANVRAEYRKCMSEYHPDKVAHLGVDLKKVAQEKTKKYNAAFNVIKKYFGEVGGY